MSFGLGTTFEVGHRQTAIGGETCGCY